MAEVVKQLPKEGFLVTVRGQYYARAKGDIKGKVLKNYRIQVILPSADRALSIIKHKILNRKLPKVYDDYVAYRTHIIEELVDLSGRTTTGKLNMMSKQQISDYVSKAHLPVHVETYEDIQELRQAIIDAEQDPAGFLKRDAKRLEDRRLDQTLLALNPELQDDVEIEGDVEGIGEADEIQGPNTGKTPVDLG